MADDLLDPATPIRVSGHETFPLRLLWLKKAFDVTRGDLPAGRRTFHEQDAIVRFGVGKNMALSMRHWALATGVLTEDETHFHASGFAETILADGGLDPYLENPATVWFLHAMLVSTPDFATTFYYAFNRLNQFSFTRDDLVEELSVQLSGRNARATKETLKRDVEVFVRSYVSKRDAGEDGSEPLFVELGLLREVKPGLHLEFVRGPKPTLSDGIFAISLKRFWQRHHPNAPTLSVEQALYGPGSPGRIFKLDEDSLVTRMMRVGAVTEGSILWTDTAGLRQVAIQGSLQEIDESSLLKSSYDRRKS